jgi:hypothetical protein
MPSILLVPVGDRPDESLVSGLDHDLEPPAGLGATEDDQSVRPPADG